MKLSKIIAAIAVVAVGFSLSACGGDPTEKASKSSSETITVGSANFAENEIIAEIYAQALKDNGVTVKTRLKIGAREAYIPALKDKEIDLIPEYTGNLLAYFDKDAQATSTEDVEAALKDAVPDELEVLKPSPAEDKDSINVTPEFAKKNNVTSLADLKGMDDLRLAANPEFGERPYGIPGLKKFYGVTIAPRNFVKIDDGGGKTTLDALLSNKVQLADIFSTTPSIVDNDLVTLEDPKHMIAAQNVILLINDDKDSDRIVGVLNKVSAALTTRDLLELNSKNQGSDKVSASKLAKQWLVDKNLF